MHEAYVNSTRDTLVFGIPFIAILVLGVFRLDGLLLSPKKTRKTGWSGCGLDQNGEPLLVDPDGRPSQKLPKR